MSIEELDWVQVESGVEIGRDEEGEGPEIHKCLYTWETADLYATEETSVLLETEDSSSTAPPIPIVLSMQLRNWNGEEKMVHIKVAGSWGSGLWKQTPKAVLEVIEFWVHKWWMVKVQLV